MGQNDYKPLKTGFTRVFIIPGRARGDHRPEYLSSLKMGAISQSFGDVTKIEIPDPNEFGKYVEADRIRGAVERATFSLMGRYAATIKSRVLSLAQQGCPVDVQLHIGECSDPSNFNVFSKAVIAEDSIVTNHSTDELGSLESGENGPVNETAEISARDYYEVLPLSFAQRAGDLVSNSVNDVVVYDTASCGTCATESSGCQQVFAVTNGAGGSPTTPPDILYSNDGGVTWRAEDVDVLLTAQDANGVAGVGENVVVVSNTGVCLAYAAISDFQNRVDPVFTKVTTGFVASGKPNAIFSLGRKAFIVGDAGYVYYTEEPSAGVSVVDAGVATSSKLNAVHAFDDQNAVAVGNDGTVILTTDKDSWDVTPAKPVGYGIHLTSVFMKSKTEFWVTTANGKVFFTLNSGRAWTEKIMPGAAPTKMNDITFSKASVGFAVGIVSSRARLYRTFDGGYSWIVAPESGGSIPASTEIKSLAACKQDPNLVILGGLNSNGTDGILILGKS